MDDITNTTKCKESNILENQYRYIVDETNIVSKTDARGIITFANKKFVEISGYNEDELIGRPHSLIRDPDTPSSVFKNLWQTIKSKNIWQGIITNIHQDGSKYTVEASIFPILGSDREVIEYIAIRHDITKIVRLNQKLENLYTYNTNQEHIARKKLEAGIINELNSDECKTLYFASDILSGDFYSIYRREDGAKFIYLIDGQGHGVSPALTVFATSSTFNHLVDLSDNLDILTSKLFPRIKSFLGEEEQLSYTIIMICPSSNTLSYVSAGMYPFLLKKFDGKIERFKANNTPFMNFSQIPSVNKIDMNQFESLLVYSDGIVEHEDENLKKFEVESLIKEPKLIDEVAEVLNDLEIEDDITLVYVNSIIN